MSAVVVPRLIQSPIDVVREYAAKMVDITDRLLRENGDLQRKHIGVHVQLEDALDRIHELETKVREKDQLIEELQDMRARSR